MAQNNSNDSYLIDPFDHLTELLRAVKSDADLLRIASKTNKHCARAIIDESEKGRAIACFFASVLILYFDIELESKTNDAYIKAQAWAAQIEDQKARFEKYVMANNE